MLWVRIPSAPLRSSYVDVVVWHIRLGLHPGHTGSNPVPRTWASMPIACGRLTAHSIFYRKTYSRVVLTILHERAREL